MSFQVVKDFEQDIADFFSAPYAVAVDCCTHGLELCLRLDDIRAISVPTNTYISVPFLAEKLGILRSWNTHAWEDYYYLTPYIIDAAVLWKRGSYIPGTKMSVSFQFKKHLSLGRGGMILLDNEEEAIALKKMSYDGRHPDEPWIEQNIATVGYHYYMTPETAKLGMSKLVEAINTAPIRLTNEDYPDLTKQMDIFK